MRNKLATIVFAVLLVPVLAHAQTKTPAPAKPAKQQLSIVLVHGAWADGSSWDKVVPMLQAKGFAVVSVHLPLTTTADDVAATTRAIEQQPGDVVLVGHSYGGQVISLAGNDSKVKALVYVDAFALDEGESLSAVTKKSPPPWFKALKVDSGGFAWLTPETVTKDFAQDLPSAEQKLVTAKQGPIALKNFDEVMKNPAWKNKPSWYVRGTADHIIDPGFQATMAKRMKATTTSIDASHVSMLSKPREVSNVIMDAAKGAAATASR